MLGDPWVFEDPAWALDGRVIRHQCPPLRTAVALLTHPSPVPLVVGTMGPADADRLYESVLCGWPSESGMLDIVADHLGETWFCRPRWEAQRLWQQTLGAWGTIDGELLLRGINVMDLPPARATNVVMAVWRKLLGGSNDWEPWIAKLTATPLRVQRRQMRLDAAKNIDSGFGDAFAAFAQLEQGSAMVTSEIIDDDTDTLM
ncbi:hypothetical protein HH308_06350 [Gordonia sp. TBRC 11910]|uniref:Uncharacterized protein n=1 Tax=Gordonia asplenii TaxID=2725283 RepID=A0A848KWJ6_9ACTN|nr:hypothetical protein [Gordonia asplenii]NMO00833.1 hypothetical protein [Gordonia asplenii]